MVYLILKLHEILVSKIQYTQMDLLITIQEENHLLYISSSIPNAVKLLAQHFCCHLSHPQNQEVEAKIQSL